MNLGKKEKFCTKKSLWTYTKDDLAKAVEFSLQYEKTFSVRAVAKLFSIPERTLRDNIKRRKELNPANIVATSLHPPSLIEKDIINGIVLASENGWILSEDNIQEVIQKYCSEIPDLQKKISFDFQKQCIHNFNKYKNDLILGNENLSSVPPKNEISQHFRERFLRLLKEKLLKSNIMNNQRKIFVLSELQLETVYKCKDKGINVLFCCNAEGEFLHPSIIHKENNGDDFKMQVDSRSIHPLASKSGFLETEMFERWLKIVFIPFINENTINLPVILIIDSYESRVTYDIVQKAEKLGVILMTLPPHSSNELHPFNIRILNTLILNWSEIRTTFYERSKLKEISSNTFPPLLKLLFTNLVSNKDTVINGFAACGICPFNENVFENMHVSNVLSNNDKIFQSNASYNFNISQINSIKIEKGIESETNMERLTESEANSIKVEKSSETTSLDFEKTIESCNRLISASHASRKAIRKNRNSRKSKRKLRKREKSEETVNNSNKSPENLTANPEPIKCDPKHVKPKDFLQQQSESLNPIPFPREVKFEEKIFTENESEIIKPDILESVDTLHRTKVPTQILKKTYKLKQCFIPLKKDVKTLQKAKDPHRHRKTCKAKPCIIPLPNILSKEYLNSVENSGGSNIDSSLEAVENSSNIDISVFCECVEKKCTKLGEVNAKQEIEQVFIKEEKGDEIDLPHDQQNQSKILRHNSNFSILGGENYKLNLFPMFVDDASTKCLDKNDTDNNQGDISCSIFLNNSNNEIRKELLKMQSKMQLGDSYCFGNEFRNNCKRKLKNDTKAKAKKRRKTK